MSCNSDRLKLPIAERPKNPAGARQWRSLEELARSEEVPPWIANEFPSGAAAWSDPVSRRRFLTMMGASLALAGISGCSVEPAPEEEIVPYVHPPEFVVPGQPLFFATTMTIASDAVGLLVEDHMGRPTKIEGNPTHPASLGATGPMQQAAVLELYDPDRSQSVTYLGRERTWEAAAAAIRTAMRTTIGEDGRGLRILTPAVVSPTLAAQLAELLSRYPAARWCIHEPVDRAAASGAARRAFGRDVMAVPDLVSADVVLSLDCDFLGTSPGHLRHAHDFMSRRRVRSIEDAATMNRLYVAETVLSLTGAKADHRLAMRSDALRQLAESLAKRLGAYSGEGSSSSRYDNWLEAVASDLETHRGSSLVLAGQRQPESVHLLAHALNEKLGNVGKTIRYIEPIDARPEQEYTLADLVDDMQRGQVQLLLTLGVNPAYTAPADVPFAAAASKVPLRAHLGLYQDETARLSHWHLPQAHFLEAWSDARTFDGTASIVQPLIRPLYQGRSAHEVLAMLSEPTVTDGRQIVRRHWQQAWQTDGADDAFERRWKTALHDGVIADSASPAVDVRMGSDWQQAIAQAPLPAAKASDLELAFLPDPAVYDGRFANNAWLQELPKPATLLTWGNAAIVSPATARRLGLAQGSYVHGGQRGGYHMPLVELALGDRKLTAPLWIMAGYADHTVTLYLGGGRRFAGRVANDVGADAYHLRRSNTPWFASGLRLRGLEETAVVACTQAHHGMDDRAPVQSGTLEEFRRDPEFVAHRMHHPDYAAGEASQSLPVFYPPRDYSPPLKKWGMSIDLTSCIGCQACVVACQAENDMPVVGKEQVAFGREMHWLRVDRYLEGEAERPERFHFQPVPCMHCENAPCEYVCPVEATAHSAEGLNDMVYNRCVGTRFCSNNCPYKVRRFNFLAYADFDAGSRRLQFNPDVTVRSRGVMEKCTYCVQRIRQGEIAAETANRPLADGEILTACQAVCPTRAIVFGDMNDPASEVHREKQSPLDYALLEETNTRPRTTYLAELRNPNPQYEETG